MTQPNATELIRADHREVDSLYQQYKGLAGQPQPKRALTEQICHALEVHVQVEESLFYPVLQAKVGRSGNDLIGEALKEHTAMKQLISQLQTSSMEEAEAEATLHALMQGVQQHVREEEEELLPAAERHLGGELERLGAEMYQKKQLLLSTMPSHPHAGRGRSHNA